MCTAKTQMGDLWAEAVFEQGAPAGRGGLRAGVARGQGRSVGRSDLRTVALCGRRAGGNIELAKATVPSLLTKRRQPAYRKSSSWLPVLSKKATSSLDDQMTSQSPALATWHSLRPAQFLVSACML